MLQLELHIYIHPENLENTQSIKLEVHVWSSGCHYSTALSPLINCHFQMLTNAPLKCGS